MGAIAFLGSGNMLNNSGTLSPGGTGRVFTAQVTGNLAQTGSGKYLADLDFRSNTADRLNVSGTSALAGAVSINRLNRENAQPGAREITILSSAGGVTNQGLTVTAPPSITTTYELLYPNATDVVLSYTVNFLPQNLPARLQSIGNAISVIQASGAFPGFGPIAAALMDAPSLAALTQAYDTLGGGGTAGVQNTAFATGGMFLTTMFDQALFWSAGGQGDANGMSFADVSPGPLQFASSTSGSNGRDAFAQLRLDSNPQPNRWRVWVSGMGGRQSIDGSASDPGLAQSTFGGAMGFDRQVSPNWLVGASVGASDSWFSVAERATSGTSAGAHMGVYSMGLFGNAYLSGALGYSVYSDTIRRTIAGITAAEQAKADFTSHQLSGRVEHGYRFPVERFVLTPFAAVEFSQLWQPSYTETSFTSTGPGILGLTFGSQSTLSLPASLGLQLGYRHVFGDGAVLSPFARVAWVHEFEPNRQVRPAFNVAPTVSFVSTGAHAVSDFARFDVGAKLEAKPGLSMFARFTGEVASNSRSYAVTVGHRFTW
jgi:outer membrane autotransporter protein